MNEAQAHLGSTLLVIAEAAVRASALREIANMLVPRASVVVTDTVAISEGPFPPTDAAIVDAGPAMRPALDALRVLRARGFAGPIVMITAAPNDETLRGTAQSLGVRCIARSVVDAEPARLGEVLVAALGESSPLAPEVAYARRVFAAGQATLSLQHSINNPLAALLAEAQLLQLEELTKEQRDSVDRMVELCRRVVALVRRLDVLAGG